MAGRKRRTRRGSRQQDNEDELNIQDSIDVDEQNGANVPSDHIANGTQRKSKRLKTNQPAAPSPTPVKLVESNPAETPDDHADAQPTEQDVPHPRTHTYGTRTGNQFRRPGQDVGLNWEETRKEKDAADAARARKRAQEDLKKAKVRAKAQHEHNGIERIAALELSREQEDNKESEYVGRTGTACGYRNAASKATTSSSLRFKNTCIGDVSGSEYEDNGAEHEESHDETAREPLQAEGQPAKKKPKTAAERKRERQKQVRGRIAEARENLPKKPGLNAGYSQASSAGVPSDIEDDGDDHGHPRAHNSTHGGKSRATPSALLSRELESDVVNDSPDLWEPARMSPLNNHLKKATRKGGRFGAMCVVISDEDVDHERVPPPKKSGPKVARSGAATARHHAEKSEDDDDDEEQDEDEDEDEDAFHPTYRKALHHKGSYPISLSSTPTREARAPHTSNSAAPTPFQLCFRLSSASPPPVATPSARRATTPNGGNETRGLNDEDVAVSRDSILERPRGRQETTLQVVYAEADPPQKPKVKRTSQADMDPEDSLSGKSLPRWIKVEFSSRIMPTVIEHFGGQQNPWKLDFDKPVKGKPVRPSTSKDQSREEVGIVDLIQELITALFPRKNYELASTDIIVRVARQRVLNWRCAFFDRALKAVAAAHMEFKTQHPEATKRDVADWADGAMDMHTGLGLWQTPPTDKNPKPHGGLRSPFLLRTFSPHFNSIRGSVLEDSPAPIGALGLALAALDIAFDCYSSGVLKAPQSNFDITTAGAATKDWYKLAVLPNLTPRERWDTMMAVAKQHAPLGPSSGKSQAPARRRRSGAMPGSSPVRSEAL